MNPRQPYTIDDLFTTNQIGIDFTQENTPAFGNTFTRGVGINELTATEFPGIFYYGKTAFDNTQTGYRMGIDNSNVAKFYIGSSTQYLNWDGTTLTITGSLVASSIDIPDTVTSASFHVDTAGNAWWGATSLGSALAKILNTGAATFTNVTITGGSISSTPISSIPNTTATDISLLEFTHNLAFTSASATQINWASGTINLSNGRTFSISSGNTGTMAALTYIYLDTGASTTVLQTTTTYSTAIGANKILIAAAKNNTVTASAIIYGGGQPLIDGQQIGAASIVAGNIAALTITASQIAANTITAAKITAGTITTTEIAATTITGSNINTLNISGKSCTFDTGSIGGFTMSATQLTATNFSVTSGAANTARVEVGSSTNTAGINSPNAGTDIAFWAGSTFANRATAPFRVNAQGDVVATSITISGYVVSSKGTFGGDGSDGALTLTNSTTTLSLGSAATFTKNYSSISITGTGKLAFSSPGTNGTIIILKSQGAVTLTASATIIDASGCGGQGKAQVVGNSSNIGNAGQGNFTKGAPGFGGTGTGGAAAGTPSGGGVSLWTVNAGVVAKTLQLVPGGGGGAGGNGDVAAQNGATGGNGGAAIYIECAGAWNFTVSNGISVAGTNAGAASSNGGGAGGGGGGSCVVLYNTLTSNSGTVKVTAGTGSAGGTAGTTAGDGGGGGAGAGGSNGSSGNTHSGSTGGTGGNGSDGAAFVAQNTEYA